MPEIHNWNRSAFSHPAEVVQPRSVTELIQLVQGMLADCAAEALAARSMVEAVAREHQDGRRITKQSACCKYFATEALGRIADRVLQIHGGYGYIKEYAVERLYRDARLLRIYEGTSQIQQLLIARQLLKGV